MLSIAAGWMLLVVGGPTCPADMPSLCDCAGSFLGRGNIVVCDLSQLACPDLGVVGALARLRLGARRLEAPLRVEPVSPGLADLLAWTGLDEVVLGA